MTIRVALNHFTRYRFDRAVRLSPHVVRLRPAPHCRTPIEAYSLRVKPDGHFINWQQDPFGNYLARLVFPEPARQLTVEVDLVADMTVINPFDFFLEPCAEHFPVSYERQLAHDLAPYLKVSEQGERLRQWLARVPTLKRGIVDFLVDVNQRLANDIDYLVRMEPGVQSCEETLEKARGSCRDSGWLLVQILRHLGLAARFVSGYLVQLTPDVKALDGPSGPATDFTDLHAWAEVYLPGAGWVGLDPTSGLFAGEGHIPLACTPEPRSAAPITGATDPCEVEFSFHNSVTRIHEDPRVTLPYSEEQWAAVNALGHRVDRDLESMDVRLTLGGEPTFVSVDDMEAPEWNTRALGEHKRRLAEDLLVRLHGEFAPGGVLFHGQGKWYPGEPLPRWALGCFWRSDGQPLWRDPALLCGPGQRPDPNAAAATGFAECLAAELGIDTDCLMPAYEDPLYHLWQEARLPEDVDPLAADLTSPLQRRGLADRLSRGLGSPRGHCLPVAWDSVAGCWRGQLWQLRRERLYLLPGESPMGLRLPLDSLPGGAEEDLDAPQPRDPFEPRGPLTAGQGTAPTPPAPVRADSAPAPRRRRGTIATRFALCVEVRDGRLHVFLPPATHLERYLLLLEAVERAATATGIPLVLEGYEPPRDWRVRSLKVTPDPGVIEVNIHPAHDWQELTDTTETLYRLAWECRLGTEKFLLDGRHTGTGGGNHVTLGGPTPADSPFLRRPELLRSLLTYWQHHPGLSYLFSGMFIGPTSQAPRVDEARQESLYELEIAFEQMPEGEVAAPWLVDRLLRHLLVDVTGNTHRAEFCIDKLYSPDSPAGRQGLVEFRGFEMPPHARMGLVQMLLLRALVARFWRRPYRHRLVRWGTELHDRFLLPHYVWADTKEVVEDLQQAGYPFQLEWLAPFLEFRFPHLGSVRSGELRLDLHFAIEPWHVLGEEMSNQGTARFVDSSVERVQVKVSGLTDSRHVVACNGRRVPLRGTGVQGEYVAGVRYRAWQPPSALHPTIGVQAPLVFDIIDTWNGRAVAGCTYHVAHAGGRNYETFPVNAFEAESRRISRFWDFGHTPGPLRPPPERLALAEFLPHGSMPGPMAPPPEEINAEYPHTLDLRRQRRGS